MRNIAKAIIIVAALGIAAGTIIMLANPPRGRNTIRSANESLRWDLSQSRNVATIGWDIGKSEVLVIEGVRQMDLRVAGNVKYVGLVNQVQVQREGDQISQIHLDIGSGSAREAKELAIMAFEMMNVEPPQSLEQWYSDRNANAEAADDRFQHHANGHSTPFSVRILHSYMPSPPWRVLLSIYVLE